MTSAVLLLTSWLVPLHFLPWVSWHGEAIAFTAGLLLAWKGLWQFAKSNPSGSFPIPAATLPLFFLLLVALLQYTVGLTTFGGDLITFGLYIALCVLCITLGFQAIPSQSTEILAEAGSQKSKLFALASVLLLGSFVSAVIAFTQVLELWEGVSWINRMPALRRPGGNLGQPNHLATLLLMGVASLLYLYESKQLEAVSFGLLFIVLAAALATTESRTGALGFVLLSTWHIFKSTKAGLKLSRWTMLCALFSFLIFFWTWPLIFSGIWHSAGADAASVNLSAGTRWAVWPQLLEAVRQRPWQGWGIGEVAEAHNAVAHAYDIGEPFSYSHNLILDLAVGMGLPLTLAISLVTLVWFLRRVSLADDLGSWYCFAVVLPVAVHSMLEFPFAYAYFLIPIMLALGMLENMAGGKVFLQIRVRSAAAFLFVFSAVAAWSALEYVAVEEDFRVARFEALNLGKTPVNYERPRIVLLTQLGGLLDGARVVPRPGMPLEELEMAKKLALRYPWTAIQNRYALALALNGNKPEAIRQLRVIRVMHGETNYLAIKTHWNTLAQNKYQQLQGIGDL